MVLLFFLSLVACIASQEPEAIYKINLQLSPLVDSLDVKAELREHLSAPGCRHDLDLNLKEVRLSCASTDGTPDSLTIRGSYLFEDTSYELVENKRSNLVLKTITVTLGRGKNSRPDFRESIEGAKILSARIVGDSEGLTQNPSLSRDMRVPEYLWDKLEFSVVLNGRVKYYKLKAKEDPRLTLPDPPAQILSVEPRREGQNTKLPEDLVEVKFNGKHITPLQHWKFSLVQGLSYSIRCISFDKAGYDCADSLYIATDSDTNKLKLTMARRRTTATLSFEVDYGAYSRFPLQFWITKNAYCERKLTKKWLGELSAGARIEDGERINVTPSMSMTLILHRGGLPLTVCLDENVWDLQGKSLFLDDRVDEDTLVIHVTRAIASKALEIGVESRLPAWPKYVLATDKGSVLHSGDLRMPSETVSIDWPVVAVDRDRLVFNAWAPRGFVYLSPHDEVALPWKDSLLVLDVDERIVQMGTLVLKVEQLPPIPVFIVDLSDGRIEKDLLLESIEEFGFADGKPQRVLAWTNGGSFTGRNWCLVNGSDDEVRYKDTLFEMQLASSKPSSIVEDFGALSDSLSVNNVIPLSWTRRTYDIHLLVSVDTLKRHFRGNASRLWQAVEELGAALGSPISSLLYVDESFLDDRLGIRLEGLSAPTENGTTETNLGRRLIVPFSETQLKLRSSTSL